MIRSLRSQGVIKGFDPEGRLPIPQGYRFIFGGGIICDCGGESAPVPIDVLQGRPADIDPRRSERGAEADVLPHPRDWRKEVPVTRSVPFARQHSMAGFW